MNTYSALILDDEEFSVEVLIEDINWQKLRYFPGSRCLFRPPGQRISKEESCKHSDLRYRNAR